MPLRPFWQKRIQETKVEKSDVTKHELYVRPEAVEGQQGGEGAAGNWQFRAYKVIYNTGRGGFSIAVGHSHAESFAACGRMIAMRWNGATDNDKDIGFPKHTDKPNWFPIPREFSAFFLLHLENLRELDCALIDPADQAPKKPFEKVEK